MRGRPKAELVLTEDEREQLTALTLRRKTAHLHGADIEFFGWRQFRNRREVGSLAGLTPMPYQSGESVNREQGISKAGNRRIRTMAIEIAWAWLRFQPQSQLSVWFQERYGPGNRRSRRVGIVALARKLLIALWRYLDQGVIPDGAVLKTR